MKEMKSFRFESRKEYPNGKCFYVTPFEGKLSILLYPEKRCGSFSKSKFYVSVPNKYCGYVFYGTIKESIAEVRRIIAEDPERLEPERQEPRVYVPLSSYERRARDRQFSSEYHSSGCRP